MSQELNQGSRFRTNYVLILTLAVSIVFFAMIRSFVSALLLAAIGSALLHPLFQFLERKFRGKKALASVTTILVMIVVILGPLAAFLGVVVNQAVEVSEAAIPWVKENFGSEAALTELNRQAVEKFPWLEAVVPDSNKIVEGLGEVAQKGGNFLVQSASALTAGTAGFFLNLFVMGYAMFFFLISGREILDKILSFSPLGADEDEQLVQRFLSVARATIKGSLTIGIIQGALGGIGFAVAGIPGAAFWGTVMAIMSVIPGIGTAVVWVPAVIVLFVQGEVLPAILLTAWCAGVVSTIDNVLRPRLVGQDAEMPDLMILLTTLGGLMLFGGVGFVVGPIVGSLFLAVWDIYGKTFQEILPSYGGQSDGGGDE